MDDEIQSDLLSAHADALLRGEEDYHARYSALFLEETRQLTPLFDLAEHIFAFFHHPVTIRSEFRAELKAGLLAEARQQQVGLDSGRWSWAAIGAASAMTVAGLLAAAAWRGNHSRPSR
ncbi:MAG: hypothetical protein H0T73_10355 [Ardenticatenales bacterium]|nr:hypothetical protein [Ardenticatenales bacterium]